MESTVKKNQVRISNPDIKNDLKKKVKQDKAVTQIDKRYTKEK